MNKLDRLALIRSRFQAKNGVAAPGLIPVSRVEVARVTRAVKSRVESAMDDSTASGDEVVLSSQLQFDKPEIRVDRETDILLTAEEKRELSKVWRPTAKVNPTPVEIETESFSAREIEEFIPAIRKDWEAELADEIAAGSQWEIDLINANEHLLLMG